MDCRNEKEYMIQTLSANAAPTMTAAKAPESSNSASHITSAATNSTTAATAAMMKNTIDTNILQ